MPLLQSRRWFQFRLSTWFVLVAILAWAMMEWPWLVTRYIPASRSGSITFQATLAIQGGGKGGASGFILTTPMKETRSINPRLLYPTLALAAFAGWKAAWTIGRRVAERKTREADQV